MTAPRTAYHAGLWDAVLAADGAAAAIEARPGASTFRQRAAAEALRGFADGIRAILPEPRNPVLEALRAIRCEPGDEGEIECPECAGRLRWTRDPSNSHVWGQCATDGCLRWMQ